MGKGCGMVAAAAGQVKSRQKSSQIKSSGVVAAAAGSADAHRLTRKPC